MSLLYIQKPVVIFLVFQILISFEIYSQKNKEVDTVYVDSVPKKILYDNKIYKLNAGFTSIGTGIFISNHLNYIMKGLSVEFNFHFFKECFIQAGLSRILYNEKFYYPTRKDINISYFTFYLSPFVFKWEDIDFAFILTPIGMTYGGGYKDETYYYQGIITKDSTNTIQNNYFGTNFYSSIQCYYKFKYDLGIGGNVYAEFNQMNNFMIVGFKLSFYFSAAFKGNQTKPKWYYKKNPDKND